MASHRTFHSYIIEIFTTTTRRLRVEWETERKISLMSMSGGISSSLLLLSLKARGNRWKNIVFMLHCSISCWVYSDSLRSVSQSLTRFMRDSRGWKIINSLEDVLWRSNEGVLNDNKFLIHIVCVCFLNSFLICN